MIYDQYGRACRPEPSPLTEVFFQKAFMDKLASKLVFALPELLDCYGRPAAEERTGSTVKWNRFENPVTEILR